MDQRPSLGPCLEWPGPKGGGGYGRYNWRRRTKYLHVCVWEAVEGPVPQGKVVMHLCDNPACYRYSHLTLGTAFDNVRDAIHKGRFKEHGSKYTAETIAVIRASHLTAYALSKVIGVPPKTIYGIRANTLLIPKEGPRQ